MTTALTAFEHPIGWNVRTDTVDDEPVFIAADVCAAVGIAKPRDAVRQLDADERVSIAVDTPGGRQQMTAVTEPGVWSLLLISRSPQARMFKRWLTHEVLPAIRRTGSYSVAPQFEIPTTLAGALQLAADLEVEREQAEARALAAESEVQELAPSAQAWDALAATGGDYQVADAAAILSRDPGIKIGRDRLFRLMAGLGWIYRPQGRDQRWRVYATSLDTGRLCEMPTSHYHPRTGELVLDAPQIRVTPKGLAELRKHLSAEQAA